MANTTKIQWCDSTFNPWIGCTRVSPACDDCYAARSTPARTRDITWGAGQPRQRTSEGNWKLPLRWNNQEFVQCPACGWRGDWAEADKRHGRCPECNHLPELYIQARRRVFCASLSDWLDNEVPIEWLVDLLDLIRRTPNLDWLLLTKRIGNWRNRIETAQQHLALSNSAVGALRDWIADWLNKKAPANVWLGATVVNQAEADRDIPKLLQVPARIRFLSVEPMLGVIDLANLPSISGIGRHLDALGYDDPTADAGVLHWIICGGESGPEARPMHPDWVRSLRDQCADAGVPFLFNQCGELVPWSECYHTFADGSSCADLDPDCRRWPQVARVTQSGGNGRLLNDCDGGCDAYMQRVGKDIAGNLLDGRQHLEWPA